MANTLLEAHHAAQQARDRGATTLDVTTLAAIRNHYRGALARGRDDNRGKRGALACERSRYSRGLRSSYSAGGGSW